MNVPCQHLDFVVSPDLDGELPISPSSRASEWSSPHSVRAALKRLRGRKFVRSVADIGGSATRWRVTDEGLQFLASRRIDP